MSFFRRAGALIARFFESAADPAAVANEFQLYSKDAAGVSQLFGRSDDGTVHQITPAPTPIGPIAVSADFAGDGTVGTPLEMSSAVTMPGTLALAPMTAGSIPFFGAGGLISQDNANFFWDDVGKDLIIITTHAFNGPLFLRSTQTGGPSAVGLLDNAGLFKSYLGYFNSTYAYTHFQSKQGFFSFDSSNIVFGNTTVANHEFGMTSGAAFWQLADGASAAASDANTGRLRYLVSTQKWQASSNGLAYGNLIVDTSGSHVDLSNGAGAPGVSIYTSEGDGIGIEIVTTATNQDISIQASLDATASVLLQPLGGLIAMFGAAGTAQGAAIPDVAGGAVVDVEARAAINALLPLLRSLGLIAP